jgi:hypothetical protein
MELKLSYVKWLSSFLFLPKDQKLTNPSEATVAALTGPQKARSFEDFNETGLKKLFCTLALNVKKIQQGPRPLSSHRIDYILQESTIEEINSRPVG